MFEVEKMNLGKERMTRQELVEMYCYYYKYHYHDEEYRTKVLKAIEEKGYGLKEIEIYSAIELYMDWNYHRDESVRMKHWEGLADCYGIDYETMEIMGKLAGIEYARSREDSWWAKDIEESIKYVEDDDDED